jgi:Colicin D
VRSLVLQYLEDLARSQDDLGRTVSAIEERLASSRLQRLSVAPVCAPPDLRVLRRELLEELAVPPPPVSPPGLVEDVRATLGVEHSRRPATVESPSVPSASPDSLVHRRAVVGNRRPITLLALQRVTLAVDREPRIEALFPELEPGVATSFDVEVSLHEVGDVEEERDPGLEIGPLVGSLVTQGWTYRSLPWDMDVRRQLLAGLRLNAAFEEVPANSARADRPGLLPGGSCFVVLALDPASIRPGSKASAAILEENSASAARVDPMAGETRVRADGPQSASGEPPKHSAAGERPGGAGDASAGAEARLIRPGDESESLVSQQPALQDRRDHRIEGTGLPAWALKQVRAAWRAFQEQQSGNSGSDETDGFPDFLSRWTDAQLAAERAVTEQVVATTPVIRLERSTLVRKYKHAPDFGIHERFSEMSLERFAEALHRHVSEAVDQYQVRWRGRLLFAHCGNGRLVWTEVDGTFVTGYRAQPRQLRHVWAQPEWRVR